MTVDNLLNITEPQFPVNNSMCSLGMLHFEEKWHAASKQVSYLQKNGNNFHLSHLDGIDILSILSLLCFHIEYFELNT